MAGLRGMLRRPLTPGLIVFGLAAALLAGIAHALTPGHGKSMVAAYLAGTRGRVSDALLLGAVVTVSHTGLVFVLGLATLWATSRFSPASVEPILAVVSGVLVLGLGFWLFQRNLAVFQGGNAAPGHRHGDEQCPHEHPQTTGEAAPSLAARAARPSLRGLAAAGLASGMVPCTDALAILLAAVHLGNVAAGLAILGAFSLGLAGVLMLVGVLTVRSVGLAARFDAAQRWVRLLPVLSAGLILFIGAWLTVRALQDAGWLHLS
jgi:ABC-type nickel/cobalt efflux system permease component RcnA